jgi:hypothetical protein
MMIPPSATARIRSASTMAILVASIAALTPAPSRAGLFIEALNPTTAASGGSGSFDIVLENTGGTFQVSAFSIEPIVSAGWGVTFTAATPGPATASYLFGTYQSSPLPFVTDPNNPNAPAVFPLDDFVASDTDMTAPYFVTLNTNDVYELAHVTYSVAPGTPDGPVTVSFGEYGTSLSDINGSAIGFTPESIIINVVPEPAPIVSMLVGAACAALLGARRGAGPHQPTPV